MIADLLRVPEADDGSCYRVSSQADHLFVRLRGDGAEDAVKGDENGGDFSVRAKPRLKLRAECGYDNTY